MRLLIKVVPKASKDRVVGWVGDRLKVAVTAAPERGKANAAVIEVLAAALELPSRRLRIVAGDTSPLKTVEIETADPSLLLSKLPNCSTGHRVPS
ncbi:MAG TPA: DUF167 domain-containing protein [Planctomycetota bacterium]|nr:DUF167 domain-containing protein [Planctomycetota bacterium]